VILCCRIPEVPIAALLLKLELDGGASGPSLRHHPLVVGGLPGERKPVKAASPEARSFGVCVGMPLRQAEQLCPSARFFPDDPAAEADLARHLLAGLYALAPRVELVRESGEAYVDLSGMGLRAGAAPGALRDYALGVGDYLERRLLTRPALGIAASKFVAYTAAGLRDPAAVGAQGVNVVPAGSERSFLAPLPIAAHLPVAAEMVERLRRFGLRTLGDLAAMPLAAVEAQFGREGLWALRLARGEDSRQLVAWDPPRRLEEESRLDPPVDNLEPLLFVARGLVDRLGARLLEEGLAGTRVRLRLELEDDETALEAQLQMRAPMSSAQDLWTPVSGMVRRQSVSRPVCGLSLRVSGFCPARSRQMDLLTRRDGRLEDIVRQVALLTDAHGPGLVRSPRVVSAPPLLDDRRHQWVDPMPALVGRH
jgi:nucleotidyltransferase/DNA polymerase involved in DNA repair